MLAGVGIVLAVAAIVAGILLVQGTDTAAREADGAAAAPESTTTCVPEPYRGCGEPAAPFTDGRACIEDHADYDADPSNGCEATADPSDGTTFTRTVVANLVPHDDVDRYPTPVDDDFQLLCDGVFEVTLTAPSGASVRVDLLADGEIVDSAVSTGDRSAVVSIDDPSCLGEDRPELVTRVSWAGDRRSSEPYELRRSGSL
jgi:hypothetical protein